MKCKQFFTLSLSLSLSRGRALAFLLNILHSHSGSETQADYTFNNEKKIPASEYQTIQKFDNVIARRSVDSKIN